MQYLSVLGDTLRIPLAVLTSLSYSKKGNIIETSRNTYACRGFACREIATGFSITSSVVSLFNEVNTRQWSSLQDLVAYIVQIDPSSSNEPYHVYAGGHCICPELLFTLTSSTQTFQSDLNGTLQRCDVTWTLSGCRLSKDSSERAVTSYDDSVQLPRVEIYCRGRHMECRDDISICDLRLTPTTLRISLLLSDSFRDKSSNAWVYDVATEDGYFDVNGYGRYYVKNASTTEDSVSYECSVFTRRDDQSITKTILDKPLRAVLNELSKDVVVRDLGIAGIVVDHYTINGNSEDTLRELADSLGFLVGFDRNHVYLVEVPTGIPTGSPLEYYIDDDVVSSPTMALSYRDAIHEYYTRIGDGASAVIDSPVCTSTDRSGELLRLTRMRERSILLTVPFNPSIRHLSACRLVYNGTTIPALVMDYDADLMSNTMQLTLCYTDR